MALNKRRLKGLIEYSDLRNTTGLYTEDDVIGVSTEKSMIPTKADLDGVNLLSYKLFPPKSFAYVADTSRRGDKIALAYNDTGRTYIVSTWYVVFQMSAEADNTLLSDYLFLFFNRKEFDRYARTNSWGSAREYFWFQDMEEIEIDLPPLPVQQKYVNIYKAMVANQQSYERGLEDLKLTCDAFVENAKECKWKAIGQFIERNTKKNQDKRFDKSSVKGFNNNGQFIKPMRLFSGEVTTFKVISKGDFVYNSRVNSTIERLSIAVNEGDDIIVTPAYETFFVSKDNELFPYYLYFLLQRESFTKKVLFTSFGSATTFLSFDDLSEIKIPVIGFENQKAVAYIYRVYKKRYLINEKLKSQIKNICPILIKGSLEEGK